jgi:hypothetical protein
MRGKLAEIKQQLRRRMHEPVAKVGEWLQSVLRGYYQYHAGTGQSRRTQPISLPGASALAAHVKPAQSTPANVE